MPQVEVTFDIDANGILNVSAKDKATGKTQNITITASSGLGKDEVEQMVKEAQAHAEEDKKRREMVDLRNQADTLAYSLEKLLKENREKLGDGRGQGDDRGGGGRRPARRSEGEDAARAASRAVERADAALSHKLAESLYKSTGRRAAGAERTAARRPGPSAERRRPSGGSTAGRRRRRRVHGRRTDARRRPDAAGAAGERTDDAWRHRHGHRALGTVP